VARSKALNDQRYIDVLLDPVRRSANYRPKFGASASVEVDCDRFLEIYGNDIFYHSIGLDTEYMYAAHRAAGGMTSIYRQLGTGCENLMRAIACDQLGLSIEQYSWSYEVKNPNGSISTLTLDGRISSTELVSIKNRKRFDVWLADAASASGLSKKMTKGLSGAVFEVRQGYKSADAKRVNADVRSWNRAIKDGLLLVFVVFSNQIGVPILTRYRSESVLVLTGVDSKDPTVSSFAFFEKVLGYSIIDFLDRNSPAIRAEMSAITRKVVSSDSVVR